MNITLKGEVREFPDGMNALDISGQISQQLKKDAVAAIVDGKVVSLVEPLHGDHTLAILTFEEEDGRKVYRHTSSHILAQAVKKLLPNAKLGIGPAIENGFYYDFDVEQPITVGLLADIEKEMTKIIKANQRLERFELPRKEAIALMEQKGEPYKVELINDLPEDAILSFYKQGEFVDLCAGPHLPSTGKIKAIKLQQVAGAYWRGSEKNKMLQRIYGTSFSTKEDLEVYLAAIEDAKRRDHNKLGRELELFTTVDYIGQGLPILLPKGAKIVQLLERFVEDEEERRGYLLTKTPFMAKSDLYKISGHWDHYRDGMFVLGDAAAAEKGEEVLALRPMTCPFQFQVFLNKTRSYRDLPMRLAETSKLFRNESSGEMHGLIRVRQFTLSEGHLIVTPEQVEAEFLGVLDLNFFMLDALGLKEDVTFRFSKWDPNNKEKYIGSAQAWEDTQALMKRILDHTGIKYIEAEGEAAFYGPKLDIQIRNVHGKEDTLITVQIDFQLAERFGMLYTDRDGEKKYPIVIHRSSIGCYERTLALLIEKYAGAFPLWIAPVQAKIMTITDRVNDASCELAKKLRANGFRIEEDYRNEKIGFKIREAQMEKVPYMLVLGDKEVENGVVAVRSRTGGDLGTMTYDKLLSKLSQEVINRK